MLVPQNPSIFIGCSIVKHPAILIILGGTICKQFGYMQSCYLHGAMETPGLRQRLQSPHPQIQRIFYAKTPMLLGVYM